MKAGGILNLIGGIITLVVGAFSAVVGAAVASAIPGAGIFGAMAGILGVWGIIVGLILIVSAFKYKKGNSWALIGLIFSILGLITLQGIFVGPILGIIGSALAMNEKK